MDHPGWLTTTLEIGAAALVLLSSIITGLTRYGRAPGVLGALKAIFDFLSLVTHRDSPGSVSLPGMRSQEPGSTPPGPPTALLVLLALPLLGCASGLDGYRQAVARGANVGASAAAALSRLDDDQTAALRAQADAARTQSDVLAVRSARTDWTRAYDAARAALTSLQLAVTAAEGAVALADAGMRSSVDVGGLVADLVKQALALKGQIEKLTAPGGGAP